MNYCGYYPQDMVNGIGIRVSVFLSGCSHGCNGCFSPESHNPTHGEPVTEEFIRKLLKDTDKHYISGVSFLGGDPLHKRNYQEVINLCRRIKQGLPEKNIWLWTGYTFAEIKEDVLRRPILDVIDVLVDGKFVQELKSTNTPFRGSSNQKIIKIKNL